MTDTKLLETEIAIFMACALWACGLAFIRKKFSLKINSFQTTLLRLAALALLGIGLKIAVPWGVMPACALCIMLVSTNSIILACTFGFFHSKK